MSQPEEGLRALSELLAEATGSTVEEIEAGAESFELLHPADAEWELLGGE